MTKKRPTRKQTTHQMDCMMPAYKGAWQGMYGCWTNPAMWSTQVVYRTLRQVGGKPYTARDVRSIIKSYCTIMREQMKRTKTW